MKQSTTAKPKPPSRKERATKLYNRILAGPQFERLYVADVFDGTWADAKVDAIMNYLFDVYSKWMEDTLDEYVELVPELRDTELCERRRSAKRRRSHRA